MPDLKIGLEVQGPAHYEDPKQMYRDEIKRKLCKDNGIVLLELSLNNIHPALLRDKFKRASRLIGIHIPIQGHAYGTALHLECRKYNKRMTKEGQKFIPMIEERKFKHEQGAYILRSGGVKEYI